jgi:exosortase A
MILCAGSLILYAIGLAGDVQLFMHIATFTFLPLGIWAFIGNQLAYRILFPLIFILFCIPIGEELIPTLQEITADLSVMMLNWTGVPIYRSGLYIEIPQGRFLVAEACSGISFFIASIVIGSLYSQLNMRSAKRRTIFMFISIIFPVIANAIRVFGIILTGYLTDMKHAVGADHLIYGWVFFALVIVCLLGIGELLREKTRETKEVLINTNNNPLGNASYYRFMAGLVILMFGFSLWFKNINNQLNQPGIASPMVESVFINNELNETYKSSWLPEFIKPYHELQYLHMINNTPVDIYAVWYPNGHGELISSLNRLYSEKSWTLESTSWFVLSSGESMPLATIVSPTSKRLLSYWYVIDGELYTDRKLAKIYEIYRILVGTHTGSGLIAVSQKTENVSIQEDLLSFKSYVEKYRVELNQHFVFN